MVARDKTEQTRQHIIEQTDNLLYHKGYNLMSFSDIAEVSGIPRGNLNYYFKTKEDVLKAVIDYRLSEMKKMLQSWEQEFVTPLARLIRYANIPIKEKNNVSQFGCPMGTLNSELGKVQADLKTVSKAQFDLFNTWLQKQFAEWLPDQDAASLAMHLLSQTQGLSVLSYVYNDNEIIDREVKMVEEWLNNLA